MMKQCKNGHIYDDAKSLSCPLCKELSTDYEGRCGNCHKFIGEDEYCRYCGTKKGEGKFEPYDNFIPCIYGSPNTYIHKCKKCGTEFQSSGMSVPRPSYCYKCGNKVTCEEEFDNLSNIQGLQRASYEREFITVDGFENTTQRSLDENITLYSFFGGQYLIGGGYANGEEHTLEYDAKRRIVEEKKTGYFEAEKGSTRIENSLVIPDNVLFENDLIKYIKSKKPEWSILLDKVKTQKPKFDPPPLAGIPVYNPPKDFDPKDNFMPCVYGSPEQMSGIYGKKKVEKQKKWLFGLLLALGVSVCIILLILILLNL